MEYQHAIHGVNGRMMQRHIRPDAPTLFSSQAWISEGRAFGDAGYGKNAKLHMHIRFDDNCKNGHHTFAVTGSISNAARESDNGSIGYAEDDIAKRFPELRHLLRWDLFGVHYIANTVYLAGNRDCHGLLAGETRQIISGKSGLPAWKLQATGNIDIHQIEKYTDCNAADLPAVPTLQWVPRNRIGEGKARDLDAARTVAVWPNATDAELSVEPSELRAALEARLPALNAAYRADIESAGFAWSAA